MAYQCRVTARSTEARHVAGREIVPPSGPPLPDSAMNKDGPDSLQVGINVATGFYTLTVTNDGAGNATYAPTWNIVMTDNIDPRLRITHIATSIATTNATIVTFVTCTTVPSTVYNNVTGTFYGNNLTCTVPVLQVNEVAIVTITYLAPESLVGSPLVVNEACFTSVPPDAELGNNCAQHPMDLTQLANIRVRWIQPGSITAGDTQPASFTVQICNNKESPAGHVTLRYVMPVELIPTSTTEIVNDTTGNITCQILNDSPRTVLCQGFSLLYQQCQYFVQSARVLSTTGTAPNGTDLVVRLVANGTTSTPQSDLNDDSAVQPVNIQVVADIRVTKSSSFFVVAGECTNFNLVITNNGLSQSWNVLLIDPIPSPFTVTHVAQPTQGSCGVAGNFVTCHIGNMAVSSLVGLNVSTQITVCTAPDTTPTVTSVADRLNPNTAIYNWAAVNSTSYDPVLIGNNDTAWLNIYDEVDLHIEKNCPAGILVGGTTADPLGNPYLFTINVWNHGPSVARGVTIHDAIPASFSFPQNAVTVVRGLQYGVSCRLSGFDLVCSATSALPVTVAGDAPTITVTIQVYPLFTVQAGQVNNTATVTSTAASVVNVADDSAWCLTTLQPPPDVTVRKTVSQSPIYVGPQNDYFWTITVINAGPGMANNVTVVDFINNTVLARAQDGFYASNTVPLAPFAAACAASVGNTLSCLWSSFPVAAPNGTGQVQIVIPFKVPLGTVTTAFDNCADVTATLDRDPTNNRACARLDIIGGTKLFVSKTSRDQPVCAGTSGSVFSITVQNQGPITANNVSLTDQVTYPFLLPAGTVYPSSVTLNGVAQPVPPNCGFTGARLVCNFTFPLNVADTVVVTFPYYVPSSYSLVNGASATNQVNVYTSTLQTQDSINVAIAVVPLCNEFGMDVRKAAPISVVAGRPDIVNGQPTTLYAYTLTVTNNGPSDAYNPVIYDLFPAGFTPLAYDIPTDVASTGSCDISRTDLVTGRRIILCTFAGDFRAPSNPGPRRTETIIVYFSVDESFPVTDFVLNCANVTSDATGAGNQIGPLSHLSDCNTTSVTNQVDLWVTKASLDSPICAGGNPPHTGRFTISLANRGPSLARDVELDDTIPAPFVLVPGSLAVVGTNAAGPLAGNECVATGSNIHCELGNLHAHNVNTVTVTYRLSVPESTSASGPITNTAIVSSACAGYVSTPGCVRNAYETFPADNTASANTSICALADVQIVKTAFAAVTTGVSPGFVAGLPTQAYYFALQIANTGDAWARDVIVNDFGFTGGVITSVTTASGAGSCTVNPARCTYDHLAPGAVDTITVHFSIDQAQPCGPYVNNANISTSTNETNYDNNHDDETIHVVAFIDLVVDKSSDLPTIVAGAGATNHFTINVTNAGYSRATNVVLQDAIPAPLQIAATPAGCTLTGALLQCVVGPMNAGASVSYTFAYSVAADATLSPSSVTNTASAFSPGFPIGQTCANYQIPTGCELEQNPLNNCDSANVGLVCQAVLTVAKANNVDQLTAGDQHPSPYTITVVNSGPSTARSVSINDAPFPFVAFSPNGAVVVQGRPGATCTWNANGFSCTQIGDLQVGANLTLIVNYVVNTNAPAGDYVNTVTVTSLCSVPVSASDTTRVVTTADVSIIKDDCVSTVVAGNLINGQPAPYTFTFTISNHGPATAYNVHVLDTVPALYQIIGAPTPTPTPGVVAPTCTYAQLPNAAGFSFDCLYTELAVGASTTITLEYWVTSDTPAGYVTNCARVTSNADPNPANDVDCDTNYICTQADLSITKKLLQDTCILAGDLIDASVYEVTVTNLGPSTARDGEQWWWWWWLVVSQNLTNHLSQLPCTRASPWAPSSSPSIPAATTRTSRSRGTTRAAWARRPTTWPLAPLPRSCSRSAWPPACRRASSSTAPT